MTVLTQDRLVAGFSALGLPAGSVVLVHSALSRLGWVQGGADALIDALLVAVGEDGTVLVPTLTGEETHSPHHPPVFDVVNTPCWTGRVPETFRRRAEAIRSVHPTHSVAAIGAAAEELTREHIHSLTPCDELSPYGKLARMEQGYVLLLGVDHRANTMLHHVEELAGVDYHMQAEMTCATLIVNGETRQRLYFLHRWDTPRNFNIVDPLLTERGIQKVMQIGAATARLIRARPLVRAVLQCLRANARYLCQV